MLPQIANVAIGIALGMLAQGWFYSVKIGGRLQLIEYRLSEMEKADKRKTGVHTNAD